MFADILYEERLNQIYELYTSKDDTGKDKSSAGSIIIDIINELEKRRDEYLLEILKETTVINIFKLTKKKKKLEKGFDEVSYFYKWLEERKMIEINIANIMLTKVLESLAIEIRTMKERETAIFQLISGILALVIALIAIFLSIFT